ncbi:Olfactory receptor 7A17 [Tupaia chinensis]|uniref:Olfactory receptor 7A17 n=1 Tax=Tupaia chinensis TaxID=246437 RepID=L8Y8E5_TUPCH|nr:Olfactory receptor 7A17 [Tupaia chinensis]
MEPENHMYFPEFILLGLSQEAELQPILFRLFWSMYLITLTDNLFINLATITDSHLHMPMYFFLSNLSVCDICFTSTTVPKMMVNICIQNKTITYDGCLAQMYFFILFGELDIFLLSMMVHDRFVAICHPLHYMVIMSPRLCVLGLLTFWILSVLDSLLWALLVLRLSFCANVEIHHFFCEIKQVVKLACSDTLLNVIETYLSSRIFVIIPFSGILYSYSRIISSILRIASTR